MNSQGYEPGIHGGKRLELLEAIPRIAKKNGIILP
jgi:hypothetical protein